MKFADFVIPKSLDEAQKILKEKGDAAMPVAGATAFQYISDREGVTAVDISRLDFGGISIKDGVFSIGANTRLTDLVRYQADGWVLGGIATLIPTHQIRNISTIAGNISRLFPWSEIPLGLLACGGKIHVKGDSEEIVSADKFFDGQPRKRLEGGKLVTKISIPAIGERQGFGYRKENITNAAFGLATCAAFVELDNHGSITAVRVAVGSALPIPQRISEIEDGLRGKKAEGLDLAPVIEAGTSGYNWNGKEGMSDEYAAHLARVIIQDALEEALKQAKGAK